MKVVVKEAEKAFSPVTVEITFENRKELYNGRGEGFISRMEADINSNYMDCDATCIAIRKALKEAGY